MKIGDVLLLWLSYFAFPVLVVTYEAGNRKAGRYPSTTKGHGNLSNLSYRQKKATLKIWQRTHTLQDRKCAETRWDHKVWNDQYQLCFRNTHTHLLEYMHTVATSVCRLAMSRTCSPVSQQCPTSQWQGHVSRRGRDLSVWSLHAFAGALQLSSSVPSSSAVQRLIGAPGFARAVGVSCECVRSDERPTRLAPE